MDAVTSSEATQVRGLVHPIRHLHDFEAVRRVSAFKSASDSVVAQCRVFSSGRRSRIASMYERFSADGHQIACSVAQSSNTRDPTLARRPPPRHTAEGNPAS